MKFIELLREGEHTSDIYLCKVKQVAKTKAGKNYYSLVLQDKTGTIDGKVWDLSSGIDHFEAMDYIRLEADVTCYQGALQLNIKRIRVARPGEYDARCDTSCALYIPEVGCGIKERCMGAGTACPWPGMAHCGKSCALYEDGSCALVK